ncbi:MAG: hypothetical protein LBO74_10365 [Candidatus Symbiothrix sp.]|jgi:hypothetical protein|nr:hypothetical protein [Candidatus Symbiothrix sp.]
MNEMKTFSNARNLILQGFSLIIIGLWLPGCGHVGSTPETEHTSEAVSPKDDFVARCAAEVQKRYAYYTTDHIDLGEARNICAIYFDTDEIRKRCIAEYSIRIKNREGIPQYHAELFATQNCNTDASAKMLSVTPNDHYGSLVFKDFVWPIPY